ncbi:MAG TPA: acetoacetate--CoA ligase [Steroidobacteraceae bacterium]|jgi:acetoacetyl-CoA synthetase|nr:acetoacetate--CoA ligase [Steroidobacteraceae bacterium]
MGASGAASLAEAVSAAVSPGGRGRVRAGEILWKPHPEQAAKSNLAAFMRWLELRRHLRFRTYDELWLWSVTDLDGFWAAIWDYFLIQSSVPYSRVLARRTMPGAQWFPGARLNYAEHALRHERPGVDALLFQGETIPLSRLTWTELGAQVRILATRLRALGVKPGDRVVACLPNVPEAVVALLATASIGAIWASCGPDFGSRGVLDRFAQLDPKVLFCVTRYRYGGTMFERVEPMREVIAQLGSLRHVVHLPQHGETRAACEELRALSWVDLMDHPPVPPAAFAFEQVSFDHPLWILFTSGTTGLPKPIVHGHGGILLEQLKHLSFNFNVRPRQRILYYTTTGWMMWNFLASALLSDVVPVLYDGSAVFPDIEVLWKLADQSGATLFGASPAYIKALQRAGVVPRRKFALTQLKSISLAGSPVSPECMAWCYDNVKSDLWVAPGSGGTEVCTGFFGGVVDLPVRAGEMQARTLGCAAYVFNERGERVVNEVGELVITEPMPSMPLYFWRDPDGRRYRESYFDMFPGVWRHGDLCRINRRGGSYIPGRSDAALLKHGVRIGTSEIYRALAAVPEVEDALVVCLELPSGDFFLPLFVRLRDGLQLDGRLTETIRATLRRDCSPRHVPDRVYQIDSVPYTRMGKKLEVPVKRILMGVPAAKATDLANVADPAALDFFVRFAKRQTDYSLRGMARRMVTAHEAK